jgi:nucleotidyltransferase/DNA polymerase involved in DNA repair
MRLLAMLWPELRLADAGTRPFEPMLDALDDLSPRIEAVDVGVALLDVTGLGPMWGPERRVAARAVALARTVAPLHVRCGIGDNRWLATLAARLARPERPDAPAAFRILERDELPDLPLTLLPADAATRQRFGLFGLTVMRQLAELPRSAVGAQFGPAGERLQALARGHDPRPLVPRRRPERVEAGQVFDPPLDGIGSVGLTLRRLAAEGCDRLRDRHLAPGRAVLTLRLEDAPALRVAQPFPQPALEPDWIARLLLSRVEAAARARAGVRAGAFRYPGGRPAESEAAEEAAEEAVEPRVASVTLVLDRLSDPASAQLPAFEVRAGRWEELRWSLERIRHRFGEGRIWRAVADRPNAALPEHRSRLVDIGG